MSDLSANLPQIISAAAQSPLGIMALLSLALSILAYFFFAQASEKVRVGIFAMLFVGVAGFGAAMFSSGSDADTADNDLANQPPTAAGEPLLGHWSGEAQDANGDRFQVALDIDKPCVPGQPCGTIHVSHVPCTGEVSLEKQQGPDREFNVDHFSKDSSDQCSAGGGEHFRLQADGTLRYSTDYEPKAQATLTRTP
jgi:hypothetical protein